MFERLRTLFAAKPAEPEPGDGAVTLGDVLRRDWFELWYQPKIDLRTRRLVGAEGLVRARRPNGDLISPRKFLPGASESDMLALTERVIITALHDFDDCVALGASVKLSVNVPVSAFIKLPIAQLLREEGPAAPTRPGLILEVTEDEAVNDLKIANDVADQLRALNCTLALDDFGDRLFFVGAAAPIAVQRAEDRPQLCHQLPHRQGQCWIVRDHRRAGKALRAENCRRRLRDCARKP